MIVKYKREILIVGIVLFASLLIFYGIKYFCFRKVSVSKPIDNVVKYYSESSNDVKYNEATTRIISTTTSIMTIKSNVIDEIVEDDTTVSEEYPYSIAPTFVDDGSIIYDGMTLTELTDKLNKSLSGYLTNTGYFFAKYTKETGIDPYLSVAIVLLETGCKWTCSYLTTTCNNIGGLKGGSSCNGGSYSRYETLGEGINGYLNIIYNNYYLQGLTTADTMASKYAESPTWASKVNTYIEEIKNK